MGPEASPKSCCGPYAQKRQRLEQLTSLVQTFESNRSPSGELDPEREFAVQRARRQMETIGNWMASHTCQRPRVAKVVRPTRF